MGDRGTGWIGRSLRRGVALGLVLTAAWGVSLTADFSGVGGRLAELGEDAALVLALQQKHLEIFRRRARALIANQSDETT